MISAVCVISGWIIILISILNKSRTLFALSTIIGIVGFILCLQLHAIEKNPIRRIFKIIEMILCGFVVVTGGIGLLLGP